MDSEEGINIWKAMTKTPASIGLLIYTFITAWFVGGLSVFHLYLISTNQSTYENFRYRYDQRSNPYNRGMIRNFMEVFCTGIPQSKNNFRAKVRKEPVVPVRTIAAAFASPARGKIASDIEMGKPGWLEAGGEVSDYEGQLSDGGGMGKDGLLDASPELSRILPPGVEGRGVLQQSKHYSRGRTSDRWEISPEILPLSRLAETKRVHDGEKEIL